ncbi:MAG TPA: RNA polymerase sigma factor [Candidatus Limnocylindrales bacterium]
MEQREFVVRAQAGDHEAFTVLVTGRIEQLFVTARLILRSQDAAEDAVQDALVRAWVGLRGLRDPARFDAWLHRLLVNACYRAARRERGRRLVELKVLRTDGPPVPDGQRQLAARDQLERGFARLPPAQRAVLVLHHYLGLPDAEAAEVLGIPLGTMKSRLSRATAAPTTTQAPNATSPTSTAPTCPGATCAL